MICFKCNTHFCYLCSAWLEPGNPYKHYNEEKTGCYMRLWELEGGDGDDVGIGYAGGVREREVEIPPEIEEPGEEVAVDQVQDQVLHDIPEIVEPPEEPEQELQREGPLVLRINQLPPAPAPGPAVPDPPPAVGNVHRLRGARHHRGHPRLPPGGNGARRAPLVNPRRGQRNDERRIALDEEGNPIAQEAVDRAWIQMFVQMAMNDEEDLLEDDEEDGAAWEIPVR
jgi:E3 ubiquitin-protein ligase RNF14